MALKTNPGERLISSSLSRQVPERLSGNITKWPLCWRILVTFGYVLLVAGCGEAVKEPPPPQAPSLFTQLSAERTGLFFQNNLSEHPSPQRTDLLYEYFSNGGGVAVGDVNGDGLDDLYFSGNMSYNALYVNTGNLVFEDVTQRAGVGGRGNTWKTGVSMADINGDGLLDLYVCYSGDLPLDRRVDELYINLGADDSGIPIFEERAAAYGLANPHASNQGYFFDYDRDGDLDLFLLTHNVRQAPHKRPEENREEVLMDDPVHGVRLYRNQGEQFVDVTREAGIHSSSLTYGLGAGISDIDQDGWLDLYVGNDYSPPDYLYMNNKDGTFTDQLAERIGHTSNASMGVDIADINNDGWMDIMVLDMLAEDNFRQKTLVVPNNRDLFDDVVASDFHHQYMRNTLQLNAGNGSFVEIGQYAGVSNTDWSWAVLMADYDNDGWKDVFVTNGTLHNTLDRDFLAFKNAYVQSRAGQLEPSDIAYLMESQPTTPLDNYVFRNSSSGIQFKDVSEEWGLGKPIKSTGAAYSDLDNDGDLDLVTNNINDYAFVFENTSSLRSESNYLQVELKGVGRNTMGIGARVCLFVDGTTQFLEQVLSRGYLSSVSPILHFGLGDQSVIDSLQVHWPDGRVQTVRDVGVNQRVSLHQEEAQESGLPLPEKWTIYVEANSPVEFTHRMDEKGDDFRRQPLLLTPLSSVGPAMEKADVNGDGLTDVYVGGGLNQAGQLFIQGESGTFRALSQPAFLEDQRSQDVDAVFFDANGDEFLDLYVVSGGYGSFSESDTALQDRMYLNDGAGNFSKKKGSVPEVLASGSSVAVLDVNEDGYSDLFVGGYAVPGRFPEYFPSYVFVNDGQGRFTDRTVEIAPALSEAGIISDAQVEDLNGDGREELILVGQWTPIYVFEQGQGTLTDATSEYFSEPVTGLWNAVRVEDFDQDGYVDVLAGNFGANSQLKASSDQPIEMVYADFDNNGTVDPIVTTYLDGTSYPFMTLNEFQQQLPIFAGRFMSYAEFASAPLPILLGSDLLSSAEKKNVQRLETSLFMGTREGVFELVALPQEAQFSPVHGIHVLDYNEDGHKDLLLAGNISDAPIRLGKNDANPGILLTLNERGTFTYIPQHESGFKLRGDVRNVLEINKMLVFGVNGGAIEAYFQRAL